MFELGKFNILEHAKAGRINWWSAAGPGEFSFSLTDRKTGSLHPELVRSIFWSEAAQIVTRSDKHGKVSKMSSQCLLEEFSLENLTSLKLLASLRNTEPFTHHSSSNNITQNTLAGKYFGSIPDLSKALLTKHTHMLESSKAIIGH
ncbi:hypothetical protein CEXT_444671 [Caerostris extrusa]|uniref:Uncharacterized protein n=1 Tax=Caerostris extrusa TaxID=172846 RepID=A0AAV4NQ75_CAEEX|nr:hypothetical protein CEXT_444671 [Caerostris extrusa]